MRAAVLESFGRPLCVQDMPEPLAGEGEVVVEVIAAPVLAYAREVFNGTRTYNLPVPVIPGCSAIGRVLFAGSGATRLKPGDVVFCDPTVRSRDGGDSPDICLQGWDSRGDGGLQLQRRYHHGPFAERMMLPAENAIPVEEAALGDAAHWCALMTLCVPYGGLTASSFSPGETLLVNGATGYFGGATVAVALAMGASRVIAAGRNEALLGDLQRRFGERIRPVSLRGDSQEDGNAIRSAADGRIDCVLDFLPPSASADVVRTALMTVRQGGRAMLMGGVGLEGGADLQLPYPWLMLNNVTVRGQWMYPASAPAQVASLVRAGLLDLAQFSVTEFPLDRIQDAIEDAHTHAAPFHITVLRPSEQKRETRQNPANGPSRS